MHQEELEKKAQEFFELFKRQSFRHEVFYKSHWSFDHICYRVETEQRYTELKEIISTFAQCLAETSVNGRLISTFKLERPLILGERFVDIIELPSPKTKSSYVEGFEHIEVTCDLTFAELESLYSKANFKKSGLQKAFNAELAIELDGCAVKFHHQSLESVVNLEENQAVFGAITQTEILENLKDYNPIVVGTFPLNLSVESSDVDILLSTDSFEKLSASINKHYGAQKSFEIQHQSNSDLDSEAMVVRFESEGVSFELFCQSTQSVRQRAFKHFQVEERLLKLGGKDFFDAIQRLRSRGIKTEPAFALALDLDGDPYLKLQYLQSCTDFELVEILSEKGFAHKNRRMMEKIKH